MILQAIFKDKNLNNLNQGFAFIELLIVLAIIGVLTAATYNIYGHLQTSVQLNENANELIQTIRIARTKSVARVNDKSHGVYFTSSSYTLYQGSSYSSRDSSYDITTTLEDVLSISNTITGNEVNFSKGFGEPNNTGSVTLTHDIQGAKTITINSLGSVK